MRSSGLLAITTGVCWGAITFMAFCVSNMSAQTQQPSSYEGFEGRTISKVDLLASPAMNVESFRPLLALKAREPFSMKAMRASVDALQKTRLFSQVQVSLEPQRDGLRVLFLLHPTSYVGMVYFPGATKVFPYSRLLQAVNIPDQTAYVADLLPKGKAALLHFLETEGFFAAAVETETSRDGVRHLVDITFRCQLGKRAKIGKVQLNGIANGTADSLDRALDSWHAKLKGAALTKHERYTQSRLRKSTDYLRSVLQDSGHLTPNVRLVSSSYHADTNRADVTFDIQPGPLVSIKVTGAKVSKRNLRRLIPIFEENAIDPELVAEGEQNLVNYFQSTSYFDAKVASRFDQKDEVVNIVYEVQRGSKHELEAIHFEGNHAFSKKELETLLLIKKERFLFYRGDFSNDLLRKSTASIKAFYENAGYANVSVAPEIRDHEPKVDVTFRIAEGEQDKVHGLRIVNSANEEVKPKLGKRKLNLAPGKPYSAELLEEDRNQIIAEYLNHGYLNVRFDSHVTRQKDNPHQIDVVYVLDQGNLARVGQVTILGAKTTQESEDDHNSGRERR
jgi:outer membrane protein insertion porin family